MAGEHQPQNAKYTRDDGPIDPQCVCPVCRRYSRAYLHHLFKAEEMLAMRLSVMHNLYFYNTLTRRIRDSLDTGTFGDFRAEYSQKLAEKYKTEIYSEILSRRLEMLPQTRYNKRNSNMEERPCTFS